MKILKTPLATLVVALCLTTLFSVRPLMAQDDMAADTMMTAAQWAEFSANLKEAIMSDNEGANTGALSQIIRYGHYLKFDELTVFEVMRMYRDGEDAKARRMAVVALGNMNNRWAIEFLDMLAPYEKDETIKKTMKNVVREHRDMPGEM